MLLLVWSSVDAARARPLEHFFQNVKTFSASFTQVITDAQQNTIQQSSGRLWIKRPGRFRWDYKLPYKQQIVADGKQLWVYDIDLQQVTHRKLDQALGQTPAMLLAGSGRLRDNFSVKKLGVKQGLEWVQMTPKSDSSYDIIRVGFDKGKLNTLEMVDGFGQTTRVILTRVNENGSISDRKFKFNPPKDVDVVRQ